MKKQQSAEPTKVRGTTSPNLAAHYIILTRVGKDGGFSDILGICKSIYDAEVCVAVDMEDHGTLPEDYKMEEWYI